MFNKIKNRLLISSIIVSIVVIFVSYTNYTKHINDYEIEIENLINSTISKISFDINKVDSIVIDTVQLKHEVYRKVVSDSIEKLKENKNFDLNKLKSEIDKQFPTKLITSQIYLINKNYVIYNTTLKNDLNLNMSNFLGAKEYIDNANKNSSKIYIANPSFDVLNKQYVTYTYKSLYPDSNVVLEIGFFDKFTSNLKDKLYQFKFQNSIIKDVEIFANYGKYVLNLSNHIVPKNITKKEFIRQRIDTKDKDFLIVNDVVKSGKNYSYDIHIKDKKYRIIYTKDLDKKISSSKIKSYVIKTKVDITGFENRLFDLKVRFYTTLVLMLLLLLILYRFLNNSFVKPLNEILNNMQKWNKITNPKILNSSDELSQLAKSFNKTFDNQVILQNSLEQRVKEELEKNRKKDEQIMQQSRLAQMGEMISMIAHQWRQPLGSIGSAIIGMKLQLQSKRIDFNNDVSLAKYLQDTNAKYDDISKYVQFLSSTIDDFRNFFKPNKEKENVNLTLPITRALQIVEVSMKNKFIDINTNFQIDDILTIYQNELMQVILNILKNSEDNFIEKDIQNRVITISTIKDSSNYIISIKDNGGGIPKEIITKVFDPYFSTKDEKNGTGIGLYMSKVMIEEHNDGKLECKNIDGGVEFRIVI